MNITQLVKCRDCKHWNTDAPERNADYDRNQHPNKGWWYGKCKELQYGIEIEISAGWDGGSVKSVETEANFACVYGEPKV